jgi:hypothetical protein
MDSLTGLREDHGFDATTFYQALGDELGVSFGGIFSGEIGIIKLKNPTRVAAELEHLHRQKTASSGFAENYAHYRIHSLEVPALSRILFWPLTRANMNYYAMTEGHLIFSEDLEDLKSFLGDLDSDNTWGKSSEWNKFLSTAPETNLGIIFDGLNGWPSLREHLESKWQHWGDSTHFLNVNKGSFQFSRLENSYYLNGTLQFNPARTAALNKQKEKYTEVNLPQPLHSYLAVVRNHNTGTNELLAQDEGNNLLLFSPKLKVLFTTPIDGQIVSEVSQIDFYKNKKLQYLFATRKSICLIDRLGNPVKGFPRVIEAKSEIQFLSVVDSDNTKNYKFLVSTQSGAITQYGQDGKIVPDWKRIELNTELWVAPRMVRESGKDVLIAISREGAVYGFGRTGTPLGGFPVALKVRPSGNWFFENANGQKVITLVSDEGTWIQLDLKGKIVSKSNLVRASGSSRFSLVVTARDERYVISRIDKKQIAVLDQRGSPLFEKDNPGSDELALTPFLVHGKMIYSFTDPQQEFSYFFDQKGKPIISQPLENQKKPVILNDKSGNIYFYAVNKNKIQLYQLERGD